MFVFQGYANRTLPLPQQQFLGQQNFTPVVNYNGYASPPSIFNFPVAPQFFQSAPMMSLYLPLSAPQPIQELCFYPQSYNLPNYIQSYSLQNQAQHLYQVSEPDFLPPHFNEIVEQFKQNNQFIGSNQDTNSILSNYFKYFANGQESSNQGNLYLFVRGYTSSPIIVKNHNNANQCLIVSPQQGVNGYNFQDATNEFNALQRTVRPAPRPNTPKLSINWDSRIVNCELVL